MKLVNLMENPIINKLIREEVQNIITEAEPVKLEQLKFAEPINATFINYEAFTKDYDARVDVTKIIVYWTPVFWKNPYGIHKFDIDVERVEGLYVLHLFDKQSDELVQQTQKNIADTPWKFQVNEASLELGGSLYIKMVQFDFKTNMCTITF
jgi:hypothetical protein